MSFNQREIGSVINSPFGGLFTTVRGPTAPQSTAEDIINCEVAFGSVRGRSASEYIISTAMPAGAIACDGQYTYAISSVAGNGFAPASSSWVIRAYVSGLDIKRMMEFDLDTIWCIAESSAGSTNIESPTAGWTLYMKRAATDVAVTFQCYNGGLRTASISSSIVANITSPDDSLLIEVSHSAATVELGLFKNGSTTGFANGSGSMVSVMTNSGSHYLSLGAFFYGTDVTPSRVFLGSIGNVEIYSSTSSLPTRWMRHSKAELPVNLTSAFQPTEGVGVESTLLGTIAGTMQIRPQSPYYASGRVEFEPLSYANVDLPGVSIDGTKGWGYIFSFVPRMVPTGNGLSVLATMADGGLYISVDLGTTTTSQVKITSVLGTIQGSSTFASAATTGNLEIDTDYRIAVFYESVYTAGVELTTPYLFYKTTAGGTWVAAGTLVAPVTTNGLPNITGFNIDFNVYKVNLIRWFKFGMSDFRVFAGIDIPKTLAALDTLDSYSPSYPVGLMYSFDASKSASVVLASGSTRVTEWRDDRDKNAVFTILPNFAYQAWSGIPYQIRGPKPKIYGIIPNQELQNEVSTRYMNLVYNGGVYRYNQTTSTGEVLRHPWWHGVPTSGIRGIDINERVICYGPGITPFKIYPSGVGIVGYNGPYFNCTFVSSNAAPVGGLVATTTYAYKFTIYNSQTGVESNSNGVAFLASTSGGHSKLLATISDVQTPGTNDWDVIRVYRRATGTDLYYLEQQIPRPRTLPSFGASITFTSSLKEAALILNELEPIDNFPMPTFTAACVADSTLHATGCGENPGAVVYSKFGQYEAWNPLNVWSLDQDDGNPGRAIFRIYGRLIILKARNVWTAPEDAARSGELPRVLQDKVGCVGGGAAILFGNRIAFVSSDRAIHITDGSGVVDITSKQIRETLLAYTNAQLEVTQSGHDGESKAVWFLIAGKALVYNYEVSSWSVYEVPADSIGSGHDVGTGDGEHIVWGYRGRAYRLAQNDHANKEASYSGSETVWIASFTGGGLLSSGGSVVALSGSTFQTDIEGMPCIIVTHTTARNSDRTSASYYEPIFEKTRTYNHVAGINGSVLYLGDPVALGSETRITIYIGIQYRKYLAQRLSPQGEGSPYLYSGASFLSGAEFDSNSSIWLRFRYDDDTAWQYTRNLVGGVRDKSFTARKRGRAIQWQGEQAARGQYWDFHKYIIRYQMLGPRRKKY